MKIEPKKAYSLYDINGDRYIVKVSPRDAMLLDLDKNKAFRLLQKLKSKGVKPSSRWHDSAEQTTFEGDVSEWQPPAKTGGCGSGGASAKTTQNNCVRQVPASSTDKAGKAKTGASWTKESTHTFLQTCLKYAPYLCCKQVPISIWEKISNELNVLGMNLNAQQLREKMRNLKRFYGETKQGKHGQEKWQHYFYMHKIFDGGVNAPVNCASEVVTMPSETEPVSGEVPQVTQVTEATLKPGELSELDIQEIPSISGMQNVSSLCLSILDGEELDNGAELIGVNELHSESGKSKETLQTSTVVGENKENATYTEEDPSVSGLENLSMLSVNLSDNEEVHSDTLDKADADYVQADANNNFESPEVLSILGSVNFHTSERSRNEEIDWTDEIFELPPTESLNAVQSSSSSHEEEKTSLSRGELLKSGSFMKRASLVCPIQFPASKNLTTPAALGQLQNETLMNSYCNFERPLMPSSTPTSGNCTPPKKKNTSGGLIYSPRKLNLPKTPTRKVASTHLIWEAKCTETLVQICIIKRREVSANPNSVKTWKDIAEEMKILGHEKPWEIVRAKYSSLSTFFTSVLKTEGLVNGVKWPYYDAFYLIHNVDRDPHKSVTADHFHWTNEMELLLITLYSERKDKFEANERTPTRHTLLYNEIADKMKMFGHGVTGTQCQRHMNLLISQFRTAFDAARNTGAGAPNMKHYDIFLQMFEGAPSLVAPVALSVGRGQQYTINGEKKEDEQRNTRTRTTAAQNKKASFKSGNSRTKASVDAEPANGSWMSRWQDMLERHDKRSEEKMQLFRMYIESMIQAKQ